MAIQLNLFDDLFFDDYWRQQFEYSQANWFGAEFNYVVD